MGDGHCRAFAAVLTLVLLRVFEEADNGRSKDEHLCEKKL